MEQQSDSILGTILYVVVWLLFSLFAIVDVLMVREATGDVMTAIQVRAVETSQDKTETRLSFGYIKEAVDRVIIVAGGLLAVGVAVFIEYYLRKGRDQGKLYQRIGRLFVILLGVFLVCLLIQFLV